MCLAGEGVGARSDVVMILMHDALKILDTVA